MKNLSHKNNSFNWIGFEERNTVEGSSMKLSADTNFLAVIRLWESGLIQSPTYLLLAKTSIEKYCQCIIVKKNPEMNLKTFQNNLLLLWSETNKYLQYFKNHKQFTAFIKEINHVGKYFDDSECQVNITPLFFSMFVILCTSLRFEILGKYDYSGLFYGINHSLFIPLPNEEINSQEQKVYKILHLILNHNVTFSHLSIPEEFTWEKIDFDTTQLLLKNDFYHSCPWCNGFVGIGAKNSLKLRAFLESDETKWL